MVKERLQGSSQEELLSVAVTSSQDHESITIDEIDSVKVPLPEREKRNEGNHDLVPVGRAHSLPAPVISQKIESANSRDKSTLSPLIHKADSRTSGLEIPKGRAGSRGTPVAKKEAPIRLIVQRGYRNTATKQLYAYDEGQRLLIVSKNIEVEDLRKEVAQTLRKPVHNVLLNDGGVVKHFDDMACLRGMDQIIAVSDPPENRGCFHLKMIEALNLGHPEHQPLKEADPNGTELVPRSASKFAVVVRNLNLTQPVIEEGTVELRRISRSASGKAGGRGWSKLRNKVMNQSRPFFVYDWKKSLAVDFRILVWMTLCPLFVGLAICMLPFDADTMNQPEEHKLFMYIGMPLLGCTTGLFINAWIGFYFYIHMSKISYIIVAALLPGAALGCFKLLTGVSFPFYNTPVCSMLLLTALVYGLALPHMPKRLKAKRSIRKDLTNSLIIMDFLILVFIVNRLLVTNFGQRDAPSLIVLSIMYPLLVTRSTTDCARLAEAFNRKTVPVVEAFFTFVSSVFQMIVFLGIHAKVNPLLIFFLINTTDLACLIFLGPLVAFLKKKNRKLMKKHVVAEKEDALTQGGFGMFIRWVQDPLKLKPLLVKCYCEVSAKTSFMILSVIIRYGPSAKSASFPFIHDVEEHMFWEAIYFTGTELVMWVVLQYSVEYYLRVKKCQYMLYKEKRNMKNIRSILGFNNGFITVLLLLQQTPASGA